MHVLQVDDILLRPMTSFATMLGIRWINNGDEKSSEEQQDPDSVVLVVAVAAGGSSRRRLVVSGAGVPTRTQRLRAAGGRQAAIASRALAEGR
eukprot:12750944-Heterocapsa_arctica.AAC.1